MPVGSRDAHGALVDRTSDFFEVATKRTSGAASGDTRAVITPLTACAAITIQLFFFTSLTLVWSCKCTCKKEFISGFLRDQRLNMPFDKSG